MLFQLGALVATPGAMEAIEEANVDPVTYVRRHVSGDWGELDADDVKRNNAAVREETRILSAYDLPSGVRIWIITEWDRSVTTILLPQDY